MIGIINAWGDTLCNVCILIMRQMSTLTGMTYGLINVLLFIILEPMAILAFMASTVAAVKKKRWSKTVIALFATGIAIIVIMAIPIIWATATLWHKL